MTIFRAYVETRHFSFEGYGSTADEAIRACHNGWLSHCEHYSPGTYIDPDYISNDDIGVYEVKIGSAYRDRDEMA